MGNKQLIGLVDAALPCVGLMLACPGDKVAATWGLVLIAHPDVAFLKDTRAPNPCSGKVTITYVHYVAIVGEDTSTAELNYPLGDWGSSQIGGLFKGKEVSGGGEATTRGRKRVEGEEGVETLALTKWTFGF